MPSSAGSHHGHTMNTTVFFRKVTIFSLPPAAILFICHILLTGYAFPFLGIIPQFGSAALGALLLYRDRVATFGSAIQTLSSTNIFFADALLTFAFLGTLIPTFVLLGRSDEIVVGTYGSVFLIVNFAIHAYFSAAEALHIITARTSPFQSLTADYAPLVEDYRDDIYIQPSEEGSFVAA